jgi:hypothetical protein
VKASTKSDPKVSLPIKPVLEELAFLRRNFREVISQYMAGVEAEMVQITTLVTTEAEKKRPPAGRIKELRDMLMLLRELDVKPAKGKRRDLKRIETLVGELRSVVERW